MSFKIKLSALVAWCVVLFAVFVAALAGQEIAPADAVASSSHWFVENWPVVALIVSEVAAFLPSRVAGIVKAVVSGVGAFFSALSKKK